MPRPRTPDVTLVGDLPVEDLRAALREELIGTLSRQTGGPVALTGADGEGQGHPAPTPGPAPPPAPAPPQFQPAHYTMRLDSFFIGTTRAVHLDTDHVTFGLKVGDRTFDPQIRHMGDVNDGEHLVGLEFDDVVVDSPGTPVVLNYQILNSGHQNQAEIEQQLTGGALALLAKTFSLGTPWTVMLGVALPFFLGLIFADCDGPVAVDQVEINGDTLWQWTAGIGTHSETRFYTVESQDGCGDSPRYWVTWSVVGTGVIPQQPSVIQAVLAQPVTA
jgi:hypothetical protein